MLGTQGEAPTAAKLIIPALPAGSQVEEMQRVLKFVVDEEAQAAQDGDGRLAAYLAAAHRLRKAQLAAAEEQTAAAEPADASPPATDAAAPAAVVSDVPTDSQPAVPAPAVAPAAAQVPAPGDSPADSGSAEPAGEQAAAQPAAAQPAAKRRKVRARFLSVEAGLPLMSATSLHLCPSGVAVATRLR